MHKKNSQVAGLIQKLEEIPRSSKVPSLRPAVLRAAAFRSNISCVVIIIVDRVREHVRARAHTEVLEVPEVLMASNA